MFGQDFLAQKLWYTEGRKPDWQVSLEFTMNKVFGTMIANPLVWNTNNFKFLYPSMSKEFHAKTKVLRDFLADSIKERQRVLAEESADSREDKHKRVIDTLLVDLENGNLSLEDMVSELYITIIGGYDTSANIVSDGLVYMAEHPEIQDKLYEEIMEYRKFEKKKKI